MHTHSMWESPLLSLLSNFLVNIYLLRILIYEYHMCDHVSLLSLVSTFLVIIYLLRNEYDFNL